MAKIQLDIVTAERLVSSDEVDVLTVPGGDGALAILPHHAPLLTTLKPGEIRVVKDGDESYLSISGGFMEVMNNNVTILADTAERAEEIDMQRTEEALKRAEMRVASAADSVDLENALAAMRRSQARMKVVHRRRRGRHADVTRPTSG